MHRYKRPKRIKNQALERVSRVKEDYRQLQHWRPDGNLIDKLQNRNILLE